jgi:glycosyltransferase involved in cell wall biosynthesis
MTRWRAISVGVVPPLTDAVGVMPAVRAALDLLTADGTIAHTFLPNLRAIDDGSIDVLHTIGSGLAMVNLPKAALRLPHVHTVDRIRLSPGRLAIDSAWLREHRRLRRPACWLVHGRTGGRLLRDSELSDGNDIAWLPVMPFPGSESVAVRSAERAAVRRSLNVPPGVRFVLGAGSLRHECGVNDFDQAVAALNRRDIRAAWLTLGAPDAGGAEPRHVHVLRTMTPAAVISAADLVVAMARNLMATSVAVSALGAGVDVIAVDTDSSAELVTPRMTGVVVPTCSPEALMLALQNAIDAPLTRSGDDNAGRMTQCWLDRLTHQMGAVYRATVDWSSTAWRPRPAAVR